MRRKKSPRILSIRGFFRRNHVLQMKSICKTQCRRLRLLISMEFFVGKDRKLLQLLASLIHL